MIWNAMNSYGIENELRDATYLVRRLVAGRHFTGLLVASLVALGCRSAPPPTLREHLDRAITREERVGLCAELLHAARRDVTPSFGREDSTARGADELLVVALQPDESVIREAARRFARESRDGGEGIGPNALLCLLHGLVYQSSPRPSPHWFTPFEIEGDRLVPPGIGFGSGKLDDYVALFARPRSPLPLRDKATLRRYLHREEPRR